MNQEQIFPIEVFCNIFKGIDNLSTIRLTCKDYLVIVNIHVIPFRRKIFEKVLPVILPDRFYFGSYNRLWYAVLFIDPFRINQLKYEPQHQEQLLKVIEILYKNNFTPETKRKKLFDFLVPLDADRETIRKCLWKSDIHLIFPRSCVYCFSRNVTTYELQMRSADEPTNMVICCGDCKKIYKCQ